MCGSTTVGQRRQNRSADALDINSVMFIETLILDRGNRLINVGAFNFAVGNIDTVDVIASCQLLNLCAVLIVYKSSLFFVACHQIRNRERLSGGNIADKHTSAKSSDNKHNQKEKDKK